MWPRLLLCLALLPCPVASAATQGPSVLFVNPGAQGENFWDMLSASMAAAARDLGLELRIETAERDHLAMVELARAAARGPRPPDYIVLVNEKLAAARLLDEIPPTTRVLFINNGPSEAQRAKYGAPRERHENWIGTVMPNHRAAGRALAEAIIGSCADAAAAPGPEGLIAIGGNRATPASVERVAGMQAAVDATPGVELLQTIHSEWRRDKAASQMQGLLGRWPRTRFVWAANDPMALGALDAAVARGRRPGEDVFIGGINWSAAALEAIRDGRLAASVGGHFLQGAWALVLIHDHHHGRDFADLGVRIEAPMSVIDRSNVEAYVAALGDEDWDRIDFRRFLRAPGGEYDFSLDALLRQFEPASRATETRRLPNGAVSRSPR